MFSAFNDIIAVALPLFTCNAVAGASIQATVSTMVGPTVSVCLWWVHGSSVDGLWCFVVCPWYLRGGSRGGSAVGTYRLHGDAADDVHGAA